MTNFCIEKCKSIPLKRYILPTSGIVGLVILDEIRNFIYIPLVFMYSSIIIFWNFPAILYFTGSRPIFIEDLFVDNNKVPDYDVDPRIKKKFRTILEWSLIITNSLFVGALADFWLYKTNNLDNFTEIAGVTGGILKLFQTCNHLITSGLMYIIRKNVVRESKYKKSMGVGSTDTSSSHTIVISPYKNKIFHNRALSPKRSTPNNTNQAILNTITMVDTNRVVKALSPRRVRKNILHVNTEDADKSNLTHRVVSPNN